LTDSERGELNKAAVGLVLAGYGPDEASTMCDNYPLHFADCSMTPSAIAKHATRLMKPAPGRAGNGKEATRGTNWEHAGKDPGPGARIEDLYDE